MTKNITDVQVEVISKIEAAGFENVKDNMLMSVTETEKYPFIVVDLSASVVHTVSSGKYTPGFHYLFLSCYQKAKIGVSEARKDVAETLDTVLSLLNAEIVENKIEYVDTVLSNIKVCGAGCLIEIGAY